MGTRSQRPRRRRSEMRLGIQSVNYATKPSARPKVFGAGLPVVRIPIAKIFGVILLVVLGWVGYSLFTLPEFFVYTADIQGNGAISAYEIYTISGVDSQSVFWLNETKIENRIKTALPNIKSAAVSINLPANVVIEVVERRPELLWQTGETVWWVDAEGVIVPPKQDLTGMLRVIDDDVQPLQAGHQIDQNIVEGAQALRLLVPEVEIIRYSRVQGLIAATPEGWPVYLGDGREMRAKLVVLTELLVDLQARNIKPAFIDIRNPMRPVYQPHAIIQIGQPVPQSNAPAGQ